MGRPRRENVLYFAGGCCLMIYEEGDVLHGLSNDEMMCKDCTHRLDDSVMRGNVSKCERFNMKPIHVFFGGNCLEYEKER